MITLAGDIASLYAQTAYNGTLSPITETKTKSETKATEEAKTYNTTFDDTAASLTLSDAAIRVVAKTAETTDGRSAEEENFDTGENVFARIQKFMSRSLQLEQESADDGITAADRQTIQNEIRKINLVVNNLTADQLSDTTEAMENSIDMTGNLVEHSAGNILANATEALLAQGNSYQESALALLA